MHSFIHYSEMNTFVLSTTEVRKSISSDGRTGRRNQAKQLETLHYIGYEMKTILDFLVEGQ